MVRRYNNKTAAAYAEGYLSGFEKDIGDQLKAVKKTYPKFKFAYEESKLKYEKPVTTHNYTPDWFIHLEDGRLVIIETKGRFVAKDRKKHILIKEQYPDLDLRILFMRDNPINKGSKTKYSDWCYKYGIQYAIGTQIPQEWLDEWFNQND